MKWTTEAKVGAFTIIGIALFIAGILFVGRIDIWAKPQMTITGDFEQVNGLKNGNQVKYSGVTIGTVSDIEITPRGVVVKMKIDESTQIPSDSTFSLGADGFLGDKYIQISPGTSKVYLQNGDTVRGEGSDAVDKAMRSAQKLMDGTEKMLQSINNIIGDPATQGALKHSLQSTAVMADNAVAITQNMADATAQLNAAAQQFNSDGNAGNDMRAILTNLKQTTERVDHMARSMESTVTDPKAQENIRETLHNTAQISARVNKLMGGKPYQSEASVNDTEGVEVEKKHSTKIEPSIDALYNTNDNEFRINGRIRAFNDKGMAEFGLSNIGDGTKFDLNAGKFINSKWLVRGGIFESELGLGVDYNLRGPVSLSAAMYDLNHRKYRIRSDIRLHKDTYGVIQMTRPFGSTNGGTYFGIKQVF
ncbi:MCE family protein [Veillonella denticariosi JCM 15641]|uniref:MCE family protein n=1 Tax=Veillonella denticariosi JCM 15641 TaxID=1298594 RepID=A0A2S7Z8M1_9FIRM|nr:MlaD family protein [Veillonella denticariosi]PQL19600.1 MCE family protein [Veillonella denticariosi JCM 15641]